MRNERCTVNVLSIIVLILGIGWIGYLIVDDNQRAHKQRLRAQKMYASPMFQELLPILKSFRKVPFEQLQVDRFGLYIRLIQPGGQEIRFRFGEHGASTFSLEKQEALLALVESSLPKIADSNRYRLYKKRRRMLNGKFEYIFTYVVDTDYKIAINRAPYYDGTMQATPRELS